jgi:hypothetical protein
MNPSYSVLKSKPSIAFCLLHAGFLFGLIFNPEVMGKIVSRNVSCLSAGYAELYSRRQNSSQPLVIEPKILHETTTVSGELTKLSVHPPFTATRGKSIQ